MKKYLIYLIAFVIVPALVLIGVFVFDDQQYDIIYIAIAICSLLPFFLAFENRVPQAREIVLIAVITAIAVASRIVFAWAPSFKPVAAVIIITAIAFGKETGFMVGALTALLSNIYFGQGPWTPFQMFAWGFIGFVSGMLRKTFLMKNVVFLTVFGVLAGLIYSLILDIQTMLLIDNGFNFSRYLAIIASSFPITLIYMISNAIFLILLGKPLLKKFARVKEKYGIFIEKQK
ncbi:MAG: ECF transporter S component [Bacilli bacterium]|jgi:energy-coupling factor transport system substrate-specific component|nr:ECF transporter S component [Bacilli bacterium]MDD3348133.1 ECF transporter S component [Bacilli bacterium]MDD4056072.1 ECF transporter S component [Bacilli bacterium]MDY0208780.1 ECF transporter S component [Bacilli bacterium]